MKTVKMVLGTVCVCTWKLTKHHQLQNLIKSMD